MTPHITLGEFIAAMMEALQEEGLPREAAAMVVAARLKELIEESDRLAA